MSQQRIGEWLRDYGIEQFDGACTLTYKDSIDLTLELTVDESELVLAAVVGRIDSNDANRLRTMLQMNYLGKKTRGTTISLDESGEIIVVWVAVSVNSIGPESFEQILHGFLDVSEEIAAEQLQ